LFPAKIYVGEIAAVFRIVGVSMWGATQWATRARGHQVGLGAAWFTLWGYPSFAVAAV
jgi:type IV secretion system protein VirD4